MRNASRGSGGHGAGTSQQDRRSPYRTTEGLDEIRVWMTLGDHDPVQGTLVDLSASGASVLTGASSEDVPGLVVGADVDLTFEVPGLDPVSGISAVVRHERDSVDGRVFGVEIVHGEALDNFLPAGMFSAFNRRRHYRLDFTEKSAPVVDVRGLPDGEVSVAILANVSVSGCLLRFEPARAPAVQAPLQIEFQLPGMDFRFDLRGIVRSAADSRESARRGIEFDARGSENFMTQEQQLSQFIVRRQQELRAIK